MIVCIKMKVLAIIVSIFLYVQAFQEPQFLEEWNKFQMKYGKSYRSPHEARKRFVIFNDNMRNISAHNVLYERGESSFKKGINQFTDWTEAEFMQFLEKGAPKAPPKNSGKLFKKTEGIELPESVDWREKGAVREVKDQGGCGSCWSFSTTGVLEGQFSIVKNEDITFSEQNLVDCNDVNGGCGGGWPVDALAYVKESGIEKEADYPYEERNGQCRSDPSKVVKISGYEQIPEGDEAALTEAVATKGPVSICLYASSEFHAYASGILKEPSCSKNRFTHAVLVVGYGSENGEDYYIVKNSWGTYWGDEGYIKLARNYDNMCGLASRAVIAVV
ncbi:hypothetical protein WA026_016833 [Henosepilachna vigintioctopunctata]|uniref:Uncharacterized protein n=1 Tax=Henosepilachna vigintioctopunctata TaxID=420089 RepID=A0AAW1TZS0_9CUCU